MSYLLGANGYLTASLSWTPSAITTVIWFKFTQSAEYRNLVNMYGAGLARLINYVEPQTGNAVVGQTRSAGGSNTTGQTAAGYSSGTWAIAMYRFSDATDASKLFTTGGDSAGATDSLTWPGEAFTSIYIGTSTTVDSFLNGRVGLVAVYGSSLSDGDIASLKAGAHPAAIGTPQYLWDWINGTSLTDSINSLTLTANGSTTAGDGDNPTVDAPPGGASAVPLLMQMYSGS